MTGKGAALIMIKVTARYPKWYVDEFIIQEWTDGLMAYANNPAEWVWAVMARLMIDHLGDYPPPLPKIQAALGRKSSDDNREKRLKLPTPEEEPNASDETVSKYSAEINTKLAKAAKKYSVGGPDDPDPKYGFERRTVQSSDDLFPIVDSKGGRDE